MDHEAKYIIAPAKSFQASLCLINALDPLLSVAVSTSEGIFERF